MRQLLCVALLCCVVSWGSAQKASSPPCCRDTVTVCATMRQKDRFGFKNRCNTEADFRLIQCCSTCEDISDQPIRFYDTAAPALANAECFDRESPATCAKYVAGTGAYANGPWRCDGPYAAVAFRICRLSCGYCTKGANVASVTYTLDGARATCTIGK
uniref:Uncharacterized protein n=1 Tax=Plectus sambesii TaxID=2011161 RepID=A0A914XC02_9BILA